MSNAEQCARITGAGMNWAGKVVLCFDGEYCLPQSIDRMMFPEYYRVRDDWPCDPVTGDPLPVSVSTGLPRRFIVEKKSKTGIKRLAIGVFTAEALLGFISGVICTL